jgi:hypothetical protein
MISVLSFVCVRQEVLSASCCVVQAGSCAKAGVCCNICSLVYCGAVVRVCVLCIFIDIVRKAGLMYEHNIVVCFMCD